MTLVVDVADRDRRYGTPLAFEETPQVPPVLAQETRGRVLRMALDEDECARDPGPSRQLSTSSPVTRSDWSTRLPEGGLSVGR